MQEENRLYKNFISVLPLFNNRNKQLTFTSYMLYLMEVSFSEHCNWTPRVYLCPFVYATAFGRLKSFSSVVFLLGCMTYFQMIYHTVSCTVMRHHLLLFKQLYFMLVATSCWVFLTNKILKILKKIHTCCLTVIVLYQIKLTMICGLSR